MVLNALSINLEDWYHTGLIAPYVQAERPERRIEWAVEPLLHLLEQHDVRATFFVLGDVMRHHPELVRRLYDQGHEIGCYGWRHRSLTTLEPERFAQDLLAFDNDAAMVVPAEAIVGFRAPSFSINEQTAWALDCLREHGYRYDSSVFPVRTPLYGVEDAPPGPYRPTAAEPTTDHPDQEFWEFPLATYRAGGLAFPVAGGVYLRAIPVGLMQWALGRINRSGHPFVLYLHPWEVDAATPRPAGMSFWRRWAVSVGVRTTLIKLDALLGSFSFAPLRDVLDLPLYRRS